MIPQSIHSSDDQCTVGADGRCSACGATHGAACPACGARAHHRPGCALDAPPLAIAVGGDELVDRIPGRRQRIDAINAEIAAQHDVGPPALMLFDLVAGVDLERAGAAAAAVIEAVVPPVPVDLERRTLAAVHRAELDPLLGAAFAALPAACPCGFPATRSIHAGGDLCPRGEPAAAAPFGRCPVHADDQPRLDAEGRCARCDDAVELLEIATVHGFGHSDVTMRSQVTISSPPPDPHAGARVELRVMMRAADQRRSRLVSAHLLELAAAVYRGTVCSWPVYVVPAADDRLPSGYVGRVVVEIDAAERAAALAAIRSLPDLGSRPW